jgi:hypothetical protein
MTFSGATECLHHLQVSQDPPNLPQIPQEPSFFPQVLGVCCLGSIPRSTGSQLHGSCP